MYDAMFCEMPLRSACARYSARLNQSTSYGIGASLAALRALSRIAGVCGPIEKPSPKICSVTPCFNSPSERPSCSSE